MSGVRFNLIMRNIVDTETKFNCANLVSGEKEKKKDFCVVLELLFVFTAFCYCFGLLVVEFGCFVSCFYLQLFLLIYLLIYFISLAVDEGTAFLSFPLRFCPLLLAVLC